MPTVSEMNLAEEPLLVIGTSLYAFGLEKMEPTWAISKPMNLFP